MEFNAALPLQLRPKFAEGSRLASMRDNRNVSQAWKKDRQISEQVNSLGVSIQKLTREVSKSRRRIVGGFEPQTSATDFFPFKIYQPDGTTDTFQIRDGILEFRSAYFYSFGPHFYAQGTNFSNAVYCPNTDYQTPTGYGIDDSSLISGVNFDRKPVNNGLAIAATSVPTNITGSLPMPEACQIKMASPSRGTGLLFWLKIVDDLSAGFYTDLFAQVADFTATNFAVYPTDDDIIPIGFAVWNGSSYDIQQYLNGNVTNVYDNLAPQYSTSLTSGNWDYPQILRGNFSEILTDAGGNGLFYPGDIVIDDTTDITIGGHTFESTYICISPVPFATNYPPNLDFTNWAAISSAITS